MKTAVLLCVAILFSPVPASASDTTSIPDAIRTRLKTPALIRGGFTQYKKIAILKRPLISKGTFILSTEEGLFWHQTKPFPCISILNQQTFIQKMGTAETATIEAKDQPLLFAFSSLFLSIFQGDFTPVLSEFSLNTIADDPSTPWQIELIPKTSPLNKALKRIHLTGDTSIAQFVLYESSGDILTITFSDLDLSETALSADEIASYRLK